MTLCREKSINFPLITMFLFGWQLRFEPTVMKNCDMRHLGWWFGSSVKLLRNTPAGVWVLYTCCLIILWKPCCFVLESLMNGKFIPNQNIVSSEKLIDFSLHDVIWTSLSIMIPPHPASYCWSVWCTFPACFTLIL